MLVESLFYQERTVEADSSWIEIGWRVYSIHANQEKILTCGMSAWDGSNDSRVIFALRMAASKVLILTVTSRFAVITKQEDIFLEVILIQSRCWWHSMNSGLTKVHVYKKNTETSCNRCYWCHELQARHLISFHDAIRLYRKESGHIYHRLVSLERNRNSRYRSLLCSRMYEQVVFFKMSKQLGHRVLFERKNRHILVWWKCHYPTINEGYEIGYYLSYLCE